MKKRMTFTSVLTSYNMISTFKESRDSKLSFIVLNIECYDMTLFIYFLRYFSSLLHSEDKQ